MKFSLAWTRWLNPFRWATGGHIVSEWEWHEWFAWRPVKFNMTDNRWVWLEKIHRCRMGNGGYYWWYYRELPTKNPFKDQGQSSQV